MYNNYLQFCSENNITFPGCKSHLGAVLRKLFPNSKMKRKRINNESEVCYSGIKWLFVSPTDYTIPQYCTLERQENYFCLQIPTEFSVNMQPVEYIFEKCPPLNMLTFSARNEIVNLHDIGILPSIPINSTTVHGLLFLCQKITLCRGRKLPKVVKSGTVRHITWNTLYGKEDSEQMQHHSKKCTIVLRINSNTGTVCCENCTRDVNHAVKYEEEKNKVKNSDDVQGTQCEPMKSVIPDCPVEMPEWITLTENDNKDFAVLLEQIKEKAPNFDTLLQSQISNAKHSDPRQRRWDTSMITFCLQTWTQ